jgi:hypothetical protein
MAGGPVHTLWYANVATFSLFTVLGMVTVIIGMVKQNVFYPVFTRYSSIANNTFVELGDTEHLIRDSAVSSAIPLAYALFAGINVWWPSFIAFAYRTNVNFLRKVQMALVSSMGFFLLNHISGDFDAFTLTLETLMMFFAWGFLILHEAFYAIRQCSQNDPFEKTFSPSWAEVVFWLPLAMSLMVFVADWTILFYFYDSNVDDHPAFVIALVVLVLVGGVFYYIIEMMKVAKYRLFQNPLHTELLYILVDVLFTAIFPITLLAGMTN